jgi:hypothetical protein
VRLGKVDCTQVDAVGLCQRQHIAAFPTIFLYKGHAGHSHLHYHGERTKEAILNFLVAAEQDSSLTTDPRAASTLGRFCARSPSPQLATKRVRSAFGCGGGAARGLAVRGAAIAERCFGGCGLGSWTGGSSSSAGQGAAASAKKSSCSSSACCSAASSAGRPPRRA